MKTFSRENFYEMKCLLADSDRTIVEVNYEK